ncbi:hypothetical protein TNCV_223081 [Trichonephila clavipes]|nr:hypothetical protein TNCV_223081 [Trichonephila clavipes]
MISDGAESEPPAPVPEVVPEPKDVPVPATPSDDIPPKPVPDASGKPDLQRLYILSGRNCYVSGNSQIREPSDGRPAQFEFSRPQNFKVSFWNSFEFPLTGYTGKFLRQGCARKFPRLYFPALPKVHQTHRFWNAVTLCWSLD